MRGVLMSDRIHVTAARRLAEAESSRKTFMTVLTMAAIACAGQAPERARAQQAAASGDLDELQEVVVTATKREEPLSRVPVAIDVFTGENLRTQGIVDVT